MKTELSFSIETLHIFSKFHFVKKVNVERGVALKFVEKWVNVARMVRVDPALNMYLWAEK